jgi:uncharacterized membrane protein (UPF0136 family)
LTKQAFLFIFNQIINTDESLAKGVLLFFSHTVAFPSRKEVPGVITILGHPVHYRQWKFYENIRCRFALPGA